MTDLKKSLIELHPELPLVIPEDAAANLERAEQRGEFTGARLFQRDPDRYKMIVALLAEGSGILKIARTLRVSPHTVIAVRDREPAAIAMEKERLASLFRAGARIAGEAVIEDLSDPAKRDRIPTRDKTVIAGILTERSEGLAAAGTEVPEFEAPTPRHDDFNEYLANMAALEATDLGADTPETKGVAAALPAGQADAQDEPGPATAGRLVGDDQGDGAADPGAQGEPGERNETLPPDRPEGKNT